MILIESVRRVLEVRIEKTVITCTVRHLLYEENRKFLDDASFTNHSKIVIN